MLFFLFACVGNLTYVLSIVAYSPEKACRHGPEHCKDGEAAAIYGRYILVNSSWLLGSFGTLFLDLGVFAQHFMYMKDEREGEEGVGESLIGGDVDDDAEEVMVSDVGRSRAISDENDR